MKKYIFRGDRSGVFYGELVKKEGQTVTMKNVRKLWYWDGAASLEQIALEGTKKPSSCKFTVKVNEIEIYDLIQTIPCTKESIKSLDEVNVWKI